MYKQCEIMSRFYTWKWYLIGFFTWTLSQLIHRVQEKIDKEMIWLNFEVNFFSRMIIMMKAKDQSKSLFFVIFSTLMIGSILVDGFTHYPFLVERFRKLDDNNAEEHTSENIQHCLGLFLRFCKSVSFENVNFKIFMLELVIV